MTTRKWGNETIVNTTLTGGQFTSSVAALEGGGFVVVWEDRGGTTPIIRGQRYDTAGVRVGTEINVSAFYGETLDQTTPAVTALSGGGFAVSWEDTDSANDRDIIGVVFNSTGGFVRTQNFDSSVNDAVNVELARVGVGMAAVWANATSTNIDLLVLDAAGGGTTVTANSFTVGEQFDPDVAVGASDGRIAVVWTNADDETIRVRLFNGNGTALADETQVSFSASAAGTPQVTWLNYGQFAVVWREYINFSYDLRVKIYDGTGNTASAVTGTLNVNAVSFFSQDDPQIVVLPNGGFVIAWRDESEVGGDVGTAIKLQAFDGGGNRIGGELLVNTTTQFAQFEPSIAALADGRVVVTWTDQSSDTGNIRMQIVDPRDGIVNGTTAVDTLYGNDNVGDIISANDGADIVYGLAGADTIYGGKGIDNLYGGRGDDTVYGDADNDIIYGDLGDDAQYGGDGNDIIYSAGGADLMDGGAGTGDAAFYVNELTGVTINLTDQLLTAGAALGDTLFNFERVYGSVRGANNLTGDNNANILVGGQINDIMRGGGGADVLRGWGGVDTMAGGLNNDIFQYTGNTEGGDIITDFAAGDKFQFVRTAFGNLAGANVAAASFLSVASGHAATNASQRFIFDQATKQLWYDADGNAGGAGVMIADLSTAYNILNTDLLLA